MEKKKPKDNVQKCGVQKCGVEKGNENIYPQKRMQKERMKTQFLPKRGETFFFNEKFLASEMDREKHFLVFSWRHG